MKRTCIGVCTLLMLVLSSCNVWVDERIEEIRPPQIEQDTITIPDWEITDN